jgi:hypothetical protein
MILYNVTVKVEPAIADEWLKWLREEHIPEVLSTGCFEEATLLQLIDTDESEGLTFAIQYRAVDRNAVDRYLEKYAGALREKGTSRWGNQFIAFRSLLKVIN